MNDIHSPEDGDVLPELPAPTRSSDTPEPIQDGWNYEQNVQKIEAIIARIESGELDLAQVFDEFATAVDNLQACETFLAERQRQMNLLIETLKDEPEF